MECLLSHKRSYVSCGIFCKHSASRHLPSRFKIARRIIMILFAVDPGTRATGYTIFKRGIKGDEIVAYGCIENKAKSSTERCEHIIKELFERIQQAKPTQVVCEYPLKAGPGWRSKNIVVLFHFCGMLHGLLMHHNIKIKFVEVSKWKGQIPKVKHHKILIPRFKKKYGINFEELGPDIVDSAGIGDWYLKEYPLS